MRGAFRELRIERTIDDYAAGRIERAEVLGACDSIGLCQADMDEVMREAEDARAGTKKDMRETAEFLFGLLDEIDTASDMAKGDDTAYRKLVERIQRRRFEVAGTDGYEVKFNCEM